MKKIAFKIAAMFLVGILFAGGSSSNAFGQESDAANPYIYMRDGKAYYQGEEYFFKTCNYLISMYVTDQNEFIVSPHGNYGWEQFPDQETASRYLHAHFKMIKDMGFNSVRIMNATIQPRHDEDLLAIRIGCKGCTEATNPDPVPNFGAPGIHEYEKYCNLNAGGLIYLIQAMHTVLDIAAVYDLKVFWVAGCESRYYANGGKQYRSLIHHTGHTINEQYKQALATICDEFKYNPALFAYDLYHETESFANSTLSGSSPINQISVANTVKEVNDVVKTHAPNQFTTVGLFNVDSFFRLGIKSFYYVDFLNFHPYESVSEEDFNNLSEKGMSVERYLNYFNKTIDEPWMIGENGIETPVTYDCGRTEGTYTVSESIQRITAQNILNYSANCGSLGYSYWEFADELSWQNSGLLKYKINGDLAVEIQTNPPQTIHCKLDYKEIVNDANNQNIFKTFVMPEHKDCSFDTDPYYNLLATTPVGNNRTWYGIVDDENGNHINNAVVKIKVNGKDYYTFSKYDGTFSLTTPENPAQLILNPADIYVSKYGYTVGVKNNCSCKHVFSGDPITHEFSINHINFPLEYSYANNIYVNGGENILIDYPTMITGNIYVYNNATLRINCPVYFGDNSQLKIYPGGKVILQDGAVLTAIHQSWTGIMMYNFPGQTYVPDSYLESSGNTIITKAVQGISSTYDNHINLTGTKFLNNYQDVMINNNQSGDVYFRNCDFILNDSGLAIYDTSGTVNNQVRLLTSDRIKFTNCHFEDNRTLDIPLNKTGIYAYHINNLEVLPDPNIGFKKSAFKNLRYGIYAVSNSGGTITVKNSDFKTARGIYLMDYAGLLPKTITNNTFEILYFPKPGDKTPEPPGGDDPQDEFLYEAYGVYVDNISNAYQIEGNVFKGEDGISEERYGLIANNNGQISNSFYRNNFENLENAVQAINLNRNLASGYTNGLQVLCNKFDNTKTDIFVTTDCNYVTGGIAAKQGSLSSPAGNLFSQNAVCNYNNELGSISYFTRTNTDPYWNPREWPETISGNILLTLASYPNTPDACPNYTNTLPNPGDAELWRLDMAAARSMETSISSMLEDIVDGGDTEQTVSSVLLADDNSAWLTYYELMNMSPYLSDTVLKEVSSKEQGLTAAMIRDILVANPQGIKNEDLQKLLEDRNNKLPDYMIEQIKAGLTIISAKENLEIQRAEQREIYEEALKKLVAYYQCAENSLTYAGDSIASLLTERSEAKYMYILADYYFEKSDIKSALSVLNRISSVCVLSKNEAIENEDLSSFYKFYDYLKEYYKNDLANINETHIKQLQEYELKGGRAGAKARALLMLNNATTYKEAVYKPEPILANRTTKAGRTSITDPSFSVYPNPAKEYIYVDYKLAEQNGTIQFTIADITGKILVQKQLFGLQDIIIVKTADLPEGSYNCSLYNGNKLMFNNKLIIKK